MAQFDVAFSELTAKMAAALEVIAHYPDIAAEVRDAIDGAQAAAVIAEQQAQDDARANAVTNVMSEVRQKLRDAAPRPTDQPGDDI